MSLSTEREPPAALLVLNRWVGTWKTTSVHKRAAWNPEETHSAGTATAVWTLGGHFLEERWTSRSSASGFRVFWTYDPQRQVYRNWHFGSDGQTAEGVGTWDEAKSTMTWNAAAGPGLTGTASCRFLDADSYEWTYILKDEAGKVLLDMEGRHVRA